MIHSGIGPRNHAALRPSKFRREVPMEPEKGFEFTDRRRVHLEDVAAAEDAPVAGIAQEEEPADGGSGQPEVPPTGEPSPPGAATAGAEPGADDPSAAVSDETIPAVDVYGLLATTISLLSNGAWAWLGLTPSPFTGKMERDLPQAKVAIDTVRFLTEKIDHRLSETERRDLRNLVSTLQLNYVEQSKATSDQG
jgi:hypothetical protein